MRIVDASFQIESLKEGNEILLSIESAARTCYKSEDKITDESARKFLSNLLDHNPPHLSVIEHESMRVRFICNRGFTHELVRHRPVSYSQESTRYCNYAKGKYGSVISVIKPVYRQPGTIAYDTWIDAIGYAEKVYLRLIELGEKPEEARDVLPIALKTEIVTTTNLRQWGHMFYQRTSPKAHPQMRELMIPLLEEVRRRVPVLFDKLEIYR